MPKYRNIIVPRTGLEGNNQIVSTKLTKDISLSVPGLGVHDAESLAAILGWKAEYHVAGSGNRAYEEAKAQLDEDQQKVIKRIMAPKPVKPVGMFWSEGHEEFFAMDTERVNKAKKKKRDLDPETGTTIYRLKEKKITVGF